MLCGLEPRREPRQPALGSKQLVPQTRLPTPCQRRRSFVKCALVHRWNSQVELASLGFALSVPAWVPVGLCLSILGVSRLAQKVSIDAVLSLGKSGTPVSETERPSPRRGSTRSSADSSSIFSQDGDSDPRLGDGQTPIPEITPHTLLVSEMSDHKANSSWIYTLPGT